MSECRRATLQFLCSLLVYDTIFPHTPKTRCWALSAELPAAETRRLGGQLLPDQPRSFLSQVCPRPSLARADLTQVSLDTHSWRSSHPSQTCTCVPRDVMAGVRSGPSCPPGFTAPAVTIPAASEIHQRILRSRPRAAAQQRASSQLCLPVPPPAPHRGPLTG